MTVKELIDELSKIGSDKIVILTTSDGKGWSNVSEVIECECTVKITHESVGLFHES